MSPRTPRTTEKKAAELIQRLAMKRINKRMSLGRLQLLDRIELEMKMFRGLRKLLLWLTFLIALDHSQNYLECSCQAVGAETIS